MKSAEFEEKPKRINKEKIIKKLNDKKAHLIKRIDNDLLFNAIYGDYADIEIKHIEILSKNKDYFDFNDLEEYFKKEKLGSIDWVDLDRDFPLYGFDLCTFGLISYNISDDSVLNKIYSRFNNLEYIKEHKCYCYQSGFAQYCIMEDDYLRLGEKLPIQNELIRRKVDRLTKEESEIIANMDEEQLIKKLNDERIHLIKTFDDNWISEKFDENNISYIEIFSEGMSFFDFKDLEKYLKKENRDELNFWANIRKAIMSNYKLNIDDYGRNSYFFHPKGIKSILFKNFNNLKQDKYFYYYDSGTGQYCFKKGDRPALLSELRLKKLNRILER